MTINVVSVNKKGRKFKQQKLPSWSPILTVGTVLPTFFLIGVAFIPLGIGLLVSSNKVKEIVLDYTKCQRYQENETKGIYTKKLCSDVILEKKECKCRIEFNIEEDINRDVYLYYGLTNFYQNHRRYVKSRDDRQLLGLSIGSYECEPFAKRDGKWIAPCGAIANSLFNDTFILKHYTKGSNGTEKLVPTIQTGIALATDKNSKFRNPPLPEGVTNLSYAFNGTVPPPNWRKPVWQLDTKDSNNGYINEGFIVWMRSAAFPTFRKLYARIGHDEHQSQPIYQNSLPKGKYVLTINYNFPVTAFKGTKRFIISNTSYLGTKNSYIGVMCIIVGCIYLFLSNVFVYIHKKSGKNSATEILNISERYSYIG